MTTRRDRAVAAFAVLIVAALALLVVQMVLDAQRRGRQALERNQSSTITQLAASMNQRLESALASLGGIGATPYSFQVGDAADGARIQVFQDINPEGRSGIVLVRADRVVTGGTLLTDPAVVGTRVDRPGLAEALARGRPAILPAAQGLTTALPNLAIVIPVADPDGRVAGAVIFESVIAVDSDFNKEIAELRQGKTGVFIFVDDLGSVIVSTDQTLLGKPLADPRLKDAAPGLVRDGSLVVGRADVPSAGWRLIFSQDVDEFEAGLGRRVQLAVLLLVVVALLVGGLAFVFVLRRLRAERAERDRIAQINATREEFISIVSHELRTPVAGISGFLESLIDHWGTLDEDARRRGVNRAAANARRLQALTRDVLDSSALEAGELSYSFDLIDLDAELETAVTAAGEAEPGRTFVFRDRTGPAWVRVDPDRIQQVLVNLLDNAVKNSPRDTEVEVGASIAGDRVVVSVRDHGAGIGDEDAQALFDKWVRGRSSVAGTGLGLFVARKIVEAHHGTIWVENHPEGGPVFRFTVPLAAEKRATQSLGA